MNEYLKPTSGIDEIRIISVFNKLINDYDTISGFSEIKIKTK
jgi:hypothetical protein